MHLPQYDDPSVKNKEFTLEALQKAWDEYLLVFKQDERKTESIILDRPIELVDALTVKIKLDNFVQLDQLESFKPDLMRFLRHRLKNSGLKLEAIIEPQDDSKVMYTSNDKFKYLAEKYPILEEMKKKFGLDSDF